MSSVHDSDSVRECLSDEEVRRYIDDGAVECDKQGKVTRRGRLLLSHARGCEACRERVSARAQTHAPPLPSGDLAAAEPFARRPAGLTVQQVADGFQAEMVVALTARGPVPIKAGPGVRRFVNTYRPADDAPREVVEWEGKSVAIRERLAPTGRATTGDALRGLFEQEGIVAAVQDGKRPTRISCVDCGVMVPVAKVGLIPDRCAPHRKRKWNMKNGPRACVGDGTAPCPWNKLAGYKSVNQRCGECAAKAKGAAARALLAAMTPEQRKEHSSAGNAAQTSEARSARAKSYAAAMTQEQRSDRAKKMNAARWAKHRSPAA